VQISFVVLLYSDWKLSKIMHYCQIWRNFWHNEYLCKLGKEYLMHWHAKFWHTTHFLTTSCRKVINFQKQFSFYRGLSYRNSVSPSVRLSVTLVHCVHAVRPTIMINSPYGSPMILVSRDIMIIPKFERGHPEWGRWMRVGWVRIGDFRPLIHLISETVHDTTKVTIDH